MSKAISKHLTDEQQTERRNRRAFIRNLRRDSVNTLRTWHDNQERARERRRNAKAERVRADRITRAWDRNQVHPDVLLFSPQEWRDYAMTNLGLTSSAADKVRAEADLERRTEYVVDNRRNGPNRAQRRARAHN